MQSDNVHPNPWSIGSRSLQTSRLYSRDAIIIIFPQAYALTHQFCRERITSFLWPERAHFLLPMSSHGRGQSCTVVKLPRSRPSVSNLQECKSTQNSLSVEATLVGHTHVYCLTPRALGTSTHDNKHTLQYVLHNIDCGSLSFHRWQSRDSWRNTRTRRYLGLGHASTREDSFFWTTEGDH